MVFDSASIEIVIKGVDEFSNTFKNAEKGINSLKGIGVVAGGVFAATTAAIITTTNTFADFNTQMQKAGANAGISAKETEKYSKAVLEIAEATSVTSEEAATAFQFLVGGSVDANEGIETLSDTIKFAKANMVSFESSAIITSQAMTLFKVEAEDVGRVLDILTKSGQISFQKADQLANAFQETGPIAAQLGVNIVDLTAVLGAMGDAGILGSEAGVALKRAFTELLNPTEGMIEGFNALGISTTEIQSKLNDPIAVLKLLEDRLSGIQDPIERATILTNIFGRVSGPAMAALLSQGTDHIEELRTQLESAGGTLDSVTKRLQDAESPTKQLMDQLNILSTTVGKALFPVLVNLLKAITPIIKAITEWIEKHPKLTAVIIGVTAVISGLIAVIIAVTVAIVALEIAAAPITLVVLGIALAIGVLIAIGYLLIKNWDEIKEAGAKLWDFMKKVWEGIKMAFEWAWKGIYNTFASIWNSIINNIETGVNLIVKAVNWVIKQINKIPGVDFDLFKKFDMSGFKITPVNDFILTPSGEVLKPHPNDTIIGTKNPGAMGNTFIFNIDRIQGTDPDDMMEAFQRELNKKISFS